MRPQYLTPKEFAVEIGKSLGLVMRLINAGEIVVIDERGPGAKIPRYKIDRDQARQWRAARRRRLGTLNVTKKRHPKMVNVPEVIH